MLQNIFGKNVISQLNEIKCITTAPMQAAIQTWINLYFMREATDKLDPCQRLPYAIVSKLSKTVFSEYEADFATNKKTEKIEWQRKNLKALNSIKKQAMQWALVGGECLIKPIVNGGALEFGIVRRDQYTVLANDAAGNITKVCMAESCSEKAKYFTLIETRTLNTNGLLTVENALYCSTSQSTIGTKVSLSALGRYANLPQSYTYKNPLGGLGVICMRLPIVNCIDGSHDGVSIFEPAVGLIYNAYRNEKLLNNEFEKGQSRIIASSDVIATDERGEKSIPDGLIAAIDDNADKVGVTVYSPVLRNESYEQRKQSYLRSCESLIGLKRGILSDVEAAERTATEITSSAGDYSLSIQDLQNIWYDTLKSALSLCNELGKAYRICDESAFDIELLTCKWGNGVLYDARLDWQDMLQMVGAGILKPELALAWKYDLPCETNENLADIRKKYMPELEVLL
ncbi:MAG: hypothetical protein RR654_00620 [Oscillospiraceae bacterium]